MAKRPPPILGDDVVYGQQWSSTPFTDRRRITRAISRGEVLEDGREAELAVMTARRQVTFWRWGWLIGPVVTLFQIGTDVVVFLTSMAMTSLATGGLSLFFLRRARRSIERNLPRAEASARKAGKGKGRPHPKSQEALEADVGPARRRWPWQR